MTAPTDSTPALAAVEAQRILELEQRSIRIPSPTFEERAIADFYANTMSDIGLSVEMMEVLHPLDASKKSRQPIARLHGTGGGPALMLNAHMDPGAEMSGWTVDGSGVQIAAMLGSDAYFGGFWNSTGGHINPLALARGLARRTVTLGGRIFANSPAIAVERRPNGWTIQSARAAVRSRAVVVATNAYTEHLVAAIRRTIVPVTSWQMATEPIGANVRASIIPGRQAVSDTRGDLRFFRYDRDGRLVTGGALMLRFSPAARLKRMVGARLNAIFPQLGVPRFDYVWNGRIGMTPDYLPHVHELGPDGWTWIGCNGRGVALALAIGRELARAVTGRDRRTLALPVGPVRPIPLHGLTSLMAPLAIAARRFSDAREIGRR